jgi:RNA polymerase sigma-70 factor (ECF subfamily)
MDERVAIERLLQGDMGGLDELMLRYQVQAVRAAYLVCQDTSMAEDIVQSAFIRAYERIDQFDTARSFGPWFLRSVVNDAIQATARGQRSVPLDTEIQGQSTRAQWASTACDVAEQLERLETRAEMKAAIDKLPAEQRAAIVLRYYLDLTDDEISARLDSTPSTVRWRLHAARKRLRDLLPPWLKPSGAASMDPPLRETKVATAAVKPETENGKG